MADNWQLKAVLSAVDKLSPVLKGVGNVAQTTRKYLSDVAGSANALTSKIGLPLTALSGLLGGFTAVAIKNAVVGYTDAGEAIYKGALRAGMSVEEWQRMKYVAEQSGVAIESLEGATAKLNKQIGDAAAGKNKDLAGLFKKLGISARDANGQLRTGIDMLPELADAFSRNKNPVVQARMGMALFGKSWQEMMPLLMEGSAGIEANLDRFKKLKGVMSLDDVKGAKELGDKFKDLEMVTKGFQNTIAKELVPVLGPLIEDIVQWAAANRKVVSAGVKEFVRDLVTGLRQIDWAGVIQGAKDFARSVASLVEFVGGAKNALIGLVIIMNLQTIAAFVGLLGSVWRLIWGLGTMTVTAIPAAVTSMGTLGTAMMTAGTKANALLGVLGKLSAVAAAGFAGWEIGTWLNDNVINPGVQKLTGDKDQTLGGWIYDKLHPDEAAGSKPSLVTQQSKGRVDGQVNINISGLPQGSRVEQVAGGGNMPLNLNAGYRSDALGMP